jgi:hypothetical protein
MSGAIVFGTSQYRAATSYRVSEVSMPEHPGEMPEGGEGGGSGSGRPRFGGIGGPGEMPPPERQRTSVSQLVNEIFRMRARISSLENSILAQKFSGGVTTMSYHGGIGGPNELPEGGEGGSGGDFHGVHGEIHEIAEMSVSRIMTDMSQLSARFTQLERNMMVQLQAITKRLDAMQK